MGNRLYVGNLCRDTNERDIREEFERHGDLRDILLKQNYAFVEFKRSDDAKAALKDLHGIIVHGQTWTVEFTRRPPKGHRSRSRSRRRGRDDRRHDRRRSRSRGRGRRDRSRSRGRRNDRYRSRSRGRGRDRRDDRRFDRGRRAPLERGDFCVHILGIASSTSWQDLKDWARTAGNSVVFGDVKKEDNRTYGVIEYRYERDMQNALTELHETELHGKTVYVYQKGKAPSITPSASPKRSGSRGKSGSRKRSRSGSMSQSKSRSRSRKRDSKRDSGSKSKSKSKSRSRSRSKSKSRSKSNSPEKIEVDTMVKVKDEEMEDTKAEDARDEDSDVDAEENDREAETGMAEEEEGERAADEPEKVKYLSDDEEPKAASP